MGLRGAVGAAVGSRATTAPPRTPTKHTAPASERSAIDKVIQEAIEKHLKQQDEEQK